MVIQRWQSLLLFIAVVLMAIFSVSNIANISQGQEMVGISAQSNVGYWFLNIATAVVMFVAIFMFKQLNVQKCLVGLSCLMMGASAIWGFNYFRGLGGELTFSWILLIVSFGFAVISFILIGKDQKLLKSYDRLR